MNEAQENIFQEMESNFDSYSGYFRGDLERLVAAGNIVVDIGQAVETLKASPELCDVFAGLLGTSDIRNDGLEDAATMLATTYPDNVSTNAFCAAIRSLKSPAALAAP